MSKESEKGKDAPVPQPTGGLTHPGQIAPFQPTAKPFDLPEDTPDTPPWEKADFKRKVMEAGFPGSPGSDTGFLAALYKFTGGKIEDWHAPEHPAPPAPVEHKSAEPQHISRK